MWAGAQGADVLWGRSFEVGGRLPHQPIIEALRQRLGENPQPDRLLPEERSGSHPPSPASLPASGLAVQPFASTRAFCSSGR